MNFLTPLFLLGALAVAAPVIFHLIRRATRERTRFSSLLLLQPVPPRLSKRSRLDQWPLLLLRAAALALLALAFARPYLRSSLLPPDAAGESRRHILLLDTSASMSRPGLREASLKASADRLAAARPGDRWAVLTFDSRSRSLITFPEWTALPPESRADTALSRLRAAPLSHAGTALAGALMEAAELLGPSGEENHALSGPGIRTRSGGDIWVISDFQEGSRTDGLQGREWPAGVQVTVVPLQPEGPAGNAGLQAAAEASSPASVSADGPPPLRVRVTSAAVPDGSLTPFQAGWAAADGISFAGPAEDLTLPPGQSRMLSLPWPAGAAGSAPARVLLKGDTAFFDNTFFALPPVPAQADVWCFGGGPADDPRQPLYFLQQALPQTPQLRTRLMPLPGGEIPPAVSPDRPAVFFAASPLSGPQADFLHDRIRSGHTAVMLLTGTAMAESLAKTAGLSSFPLEEAPAPPSGYAMWSGIDFRHAVFLPFADPRFSDFTKIRFWKYRRPAPGAVLPENVRILASFDAGGPALAEIPVGAGRLLVLFSGWHPADSQLALSSKFVPLLASLLEQGGAGTAPPPLFTAGSPVPLERLGFSLPSSFPVTVRLPDGSAVTVEAESPVFDGAAVPGHYTATSGTLTKPFAVNSDPMESRTAPMAPDALEALGVPVKSPVPPAGLTAGSAGNSPSPADPMAPAIETENRQKLWRWIIASALAVLLLETLLAGRRPAATASSTSAAVSAP